MTCTVKVANGTIPLPPGVELSDGAEVQLIVPDPVARPASFAGRYAAYIGAADDLPADLAANLDRLSRFLLFLRSAFVPLQVSSPIIRGGLQEKRRMILDGSRLLLPGEVEGKFGA